MCGNYLAALSNCHRVDLFTRLTLDRLQRKCGDLFRIHDECERNWHETMYVMLLRTMGDSRNKEAFTELARRVGYAAVSRERDSLLNVEALLLGTSGLLEKYEEDGYIRRVPVARDARLKKIVLMPKAEKIQLNVNKNHKQMQRQLQGPMTDEEVAAFMDTCDALAERASTF